MSSAQAAPVPAKVAARAVVKRAVRPEAQVKEPEIAPAAKGNGGTKKAVAAKPAAKGIFPTAASRAAAVKSATRPVARQTTK